MRKINKIIVHCTSTSLNTKIQSIRNYHLEKGFRDIGYHFLIDKSGNIIKGRPVEEIGAHCRGHNKDSIGVALIGGENGKFDFTISQIMVLYNFVCTLQSTYKIDSKMIFGHNEFTKNKSCPNFNVKNFFEYEIK